MKIKLNPQSETHKSGDRRIRRKFLFFPKEIGNEIRWLERAVWVERYGYIRVSEDFGPIYGWVPIEWI